MFAIIKTGGKQYRAQPGAVIRVEKLNAQVGDQLEFDVFMVDTGELKVGSPVVEGAKVTAEVLQHGRGKKIVVTRFKAKVNYHRRKGHRQPFTDLRVGEIRG